MTEQIDGTWYAVSLLTGRRYACENRKHAERLASSFRQKAKEARGWSA